MMEKQPTTQKQTEAHRDCDEDVPVMVLSHIIIKDVKSGEELVNKRA
jgi:hypothetical protein